MPPENAAAAPAAPPVSWDQITDEALKAAISEDEDEPEETSSTTAEPTAPAQEKPVHQTAVSPKPDTADVDKALAELEKAAEGEAEPARPALTPEQQQVLARIPDAATLEGITRVAQANRDLTDAYLSGNTDFVLYNLENINAEAFGVFKDAFYQKYGEEFVQRFIDENENGGNKEIRTLQREIQALKREHTERRETEQRVSTEQTDRQRANEWAGKFTAHLDSLYEKVRIPKDGADREFIEAAFEKALNAPANKETADKIRAGRFGLMNPIFAGVVRKYNAAEKAKVQAVETVRAAQESRGPITLAAAPAAPQVPEAAPALKVGSDEWAKDKWERGLKALRLKK